ncbi:MAG TPA: 16S rRNA (cytosine(1402)-N(4))-methyltransferase RsmH [Spirochaetota bacterium]|nr:16S rRNA (cytosine(1402)-N(4))-methyltransferase RsmH [Spirochaetota bacterium]HOD15445.1 16S rRNA (cytosine(1402)-N(4))-methyltransferase RsmH [Spirochaetota bacterium]HPG50730.1 16S rRNA (cytosine(1402)-N(4))-methyltransferase RsmH [Spirochaetota bacterium]HPN13288.1 16S rRNA (cytosine(1402)-N(4))-methyltransferase RsmH [Spirochaetota bacterium]
MGYIHIPVMPAELVRFIRDSAYRGEGMLVDCTAGEGGHSELLLATFPEMRITAFDRDGEILKIAQGRLEQYAGRIDFINDNFSHISERLGSMKSEIRYFLYDFGISSFHFDASGRGFSFARDERLDMRLDGDGEDAGDMVNTADEKTLADIIFRYGEERWSRRIASAIVRARSAAPVETTGQLADIVLGAIPKRFHVKNIHPATRVFQALRIAVNDELSAIERSIADAYGLLAPGGLIMAISFHSLEDRIVKEKFRRLSRGCFCGEESRNCRCTGERAVNILTKKPLRPEIDEVEKNSRARSARLRVCEKLPVPAAAGAAG